MDIVGFLTGRDAKEADVYADFDKVNTVVSEIEGISKNEVQAAKDAIHNALEELNSVNGLNNLVGFSVNIGAFDDVFDNVGSSINEIATQLESKANDVKEYSEASFFEKAGSTAAMALFKTAEGLLTPLEDIGDAAVGIAGWVAGGLGNEDFQNACADFIKQDLSRDAFSFYYDSAFAKKSAITEDSFLANTFKFAGSIATYLYVGGLAASAGEFGASALGAGVGRLAGGTGKIAKAAQAFQKAGNVITGFASSTTYANAAVAALTGLGSGTETGLQEGKDYNSAIWEGTKQAAVQGSLALAAGKLSERPQQKAKNARIGEAQEGLNNATSAREVAQSEADDASRSLAEAQQHKRDILNNNSNYQEQVQKAATAENVFRDKASVVDDLIERNAPQSDIDDAIKEANRALKNMNAEEKALSKLENDLTRDSVSQIEKYNRLTEQAQRAEETFREKASIVDDLIENGASKEDIERAYNEAVKASGDLSTAQTELSQMGTARANAKELIEAGNSVTRAKNILAEKTSTLNTANQEVQMAETALNDAKNIPVQGYTDPLTKRGQNGDSFTGILPDIVKTVTKPKFSTAAAVANTVGRTYMDQRGRSEEQFKQNNTISKDDLEPDNPIKNTGTGEITADQPIKNTENKSSDSSSSSSKKDSSTSSNSTPSRTTSSSSSTFSPTSSQAPATPKSTTAPTTPTTSPKTTPSTTPKSTPQTTIVTPADPTPSSTPESTPESTPSPTPSPTPEPTPSPAPSPTPGPYHSGGEYSNSEGYVSNNTENGIEEPPETVKDVLDDSTTAADDIIRGKKYSKIPSSTIPITPATTRRSTGNNIIPIAAGLSAAAAAGLGAKAYMDHKKNNEYDEEEDFETDEWDEDGDNIEIDYNESDEKDNYLDEDDDYGYQAMENNRYDARNSEELADLQ